MSFGRDACRSVDFYTKIQDTRCITAFETETTSSIRSSKAWNHPIRLGHGFISNLFPYYLPLWVSPERYPASRSRLSSLGVFGFCDDRLQHQLQLHSASFALLVM